MGNATLALRRLHQQQISRSSFSVASEIVAWFGAVQAQDFPGAKWALGLRLQDGTDGTDNLIEQAFTEGTILRTHVMRPTWHFVAPHDIRWLLALTASRVRLKLAPYDRRLELEKALLQRCYGIVIKALQGGKQLTRVELAEALAEHNIVAEGQRLAHIVMHAELDAILCSGPRHGKQFTYMLLDEHVPPAKALSRDEALTELIRRYYTGHGPATLQDFAWWSGLTIGDAKKGIAMVGADLTQESIDDQVYFYPASMPSAIEPCDRAFLLPTYDEFFVGFAGFDQSRRGESEVRPESGYDARLVIDGQVIGGWRRTLQKTSVLVEVVPFAPLSTTNRDAIQDAVQRYGEFHGMPATLVFR